MSTKKELAQAVRDLSDRVAELEAAIRATRPTIYVNPWQPNYQYVPPNQITWYSSATPTTINAVN